MSWIHDNVIKKLRQGADQEFALKTLQAFFGKLVESYALDAIDWLNRTYDGSVPPDKAREFLEQVKGASRTHHPSLGQGENVRFQGLGITGASLVVGNRVLHLSAFQITGDVRGKRDSRYQRFSERRNRGIFD